MTRGREAVRAELEATSGFLSAQELHDRLRHRGESIGLTTVYRHLGALAEEGEIDLLRSAKPGATSGSAGQGEALYRRCQVAEHHHHLVCRSCGRTQEVADDAVEAWAAAVAARHGFREPTHTVEVFGVCSACHEQAGG